MKRKAVYVDITFIKIVGYPSLGNGWNAGENRKIQETPIYAVAVWKGDEIVGHVPRYISTLCSLFIRHGGLVDSIVLGGRQYSRNLPPCLPQGRMEIRKSFTGKVSRLPIDPQNPQNFSTSNDLQYTVYSETSLKGDTSELWTPSTYVIVIRFRS